MRYDVMNSNGTLDGDSFDADRNNKRRWEEIFALTDCSFKLTSDQVTLNDGATLIPDTTTLTMKAGDRWYVFFKKIQHVTGTFACKRAKDV